MASQPTQQQADNQQKDEQPWDDKKRWQQLRHNVRNKAITEQLSGTEQSRREVFVETWYWQMKNAGRLADKFKGWYYISVTLTAVGAATVPTLIAFTGSADAFTAKVLRIVAAVLGVLVTGATTLLGVVEVGNRWRLYRAFGQALEEAGWDYLAGKKEDDKDDHKYTKKKLSFWRFDYIMLQF